MQSMMWLALVFAVGAMIGSFLNVCIYRLPLEKSILWPATSHCGQCFQPIRWHDNIPLVSYWLLRGAAGNVGSISRRYFFIELLTGLLLAGIFYLEVIANVHRLDAAILGPTRMLLSPLVFFAFHGLLACFLIVATFCDFDHQIIPLPLTLTGTVIGLVGTVIWAWPWPYTPGEISVLVGRVPKSALYPWPVWWRLPAILQPGGNWQTGLATGGAGVLAGTLLLRAIRFLFGFGMGAQYYGPGSSDRATTDLAACTMDIVAPARRRQGFGPGRRRFDDDGRRLHGLATRARGVLRSGLSRAFSCTDAASFAREQRFAVRPGTGYGRSRDAFGLDVDRSLRLPAVL